MADAITIHLTVTAKAGSPRIPLSISTTITSIELREKVCEATKIPIGSLRLIFRGRMIPPNETKQAVTEYKLEEGSVLHCMGKPMEETSAAATSAPQPVAATGSTVSIQAPAATTSAPAATTAASLPPRDPLQDGLNTLRTSNPPATYLTAVTTLEKILNNIASHPLEAKYQRVKRKNAAFQKRLGGLPGGEAAIKGAGFVSEVDNGEEVYVLHPSAEAWPRFVAAKTAVEQAVRQAKLAAESTATSQPPVAAPMSGGGMGFGAPPGAGMGPGVPPGMTPEMMQAASNLMRDPNALRSILQNPMLQQMLQNDPRFASNPMLRQNIDRLLEDPAMMAQLSQMMSNQGMLQNPQMRQQAMGNFMNAPGASPNNNSSNNNNTTGGSSPNDSSQTEEEMIAEAIRRSLEES